MVAQVERNVWDKVRDDYELGNYKTIKELSERFNVDYDCLRQRMVRESWKESLVTRNAVLSQKVDEMKEDLASSYLKSSFKRALKYEKLIDLSQEQLASMSGKDGLPVLDPEALVQYSKVEATVHAMAKSALRISDKVDLTSNGASIGESFVMAVQKLRQSENTPKLTTEQIDVVLDAEIID